MTLAAELGADNCRLISIIGAGGKTTLMYRLAYELAGAGRRVVTTTTTHIMPPTREQSPQLLVTENPREHEEAISRILQQHKHLTVVARVTNNAGKLQGFNPEIVDQLLQLGCVDVVVVEADGASRRPLKASGGHEPVVPSQTGLLICVCGLDGVGGKVAEMVFRSELYCRVTGQRPEEEVTPQSLASILRRDLARIAAGSSYRKVLLLNKADDAELIARGEQLVSSISALAEPVFDDIMLTRLLAHHDPVAKRYGAVFKKHQYPVAGIILAAGRSTRMGKIKLLLPFGNKTILETVVEVARNSTLDTLLLVLGHEAEAIKMEVADNCLRFVQVVENNNYRLGQSSSLQAGIAALPEVYEYALFLLADQPLVTTTTIDLLVAEAQRTGARLLAPSHDHRRGNPVMVHRSLFAAIHEVCGDTGARPLLERYREQLQLVAVDDPGILQDIDTPEDYAFMVRSDGRPEN